MKKDICCNKLTPCGMFASLPSHKVKRNGGGGGGGGRWGGQEKVIILYSKSETRLSKPMPGVPGIGLDSLRKMMQNIQ